MTFRKLFLLVMFIFTSITCISQEVSNQPIEHPDWVGIDSNNRYRIVITGLYHEKSEKEVVKESNRNWKNAHVWFSKMKALYNAEIKYENKKENSIISQFSIPTSNNGYNVLFICTVEVETYPNSIIIKDWKLYYLPPVKYNTLRSYESVANRDLWNNIGPDLSDILNSWETAMFDNPNHWFKIK